MEMSNEQQYICDSIISWIKRKDKQYITIGGYAGTGKTYLISQIRKEINNKFNKFNVAFVAFTGKASSNLRSRLKEDNNLNNNDFCGTIHSLIYYPEMKWNKKEKRMIITGWVKKTKSCLQSEYGLIIIDEASMVSPTIWKDLISYDIPIIAVGDHGQLPPINGNFNLMIALDYKLTKIHRQALTSGIILLATHVRKYGYIEPGKYSNNVFKLSWHDDRCQKIWNNIDFLNKNIICICGFNASRVNINTMIRKELNYDNKIPYPGERVVCLKNNASEGIFNGQLGSVAWTMPPQKELCKMTIMFDGNEEYYDGDINLSCFGKVTYDNLYTKDKNKKKDYVKGDFFDYGYCISVHKSQGAEFNKVILFEQCSSYWDNEYYKKWLYTGATRAKNSLLIISDFY